MRQGDRFFAWIESKRARIFPAALMLASLVLGMGGFPADVSAQVFTEPVRPATKARPKPPRSAPHTKSRPRPAAKAGAPSADTQSSALPKPIMYSDPAQYCAASNDKDVPALPYVGQPVPNWLTAAAPQPSRGQQVAYSWRCMGGRVLVCVGPIDRADCARPSQEATPSPQVQQYCVTKRKGVVPDNVAGNVLPIWNCRDRVASIKGYRTGLDLLGYIAARWSDVTEYSPTNSLGAVPRSYGGRWYVPVKVGLMSVLGQGVLINGRPASGEPLTGVFLNVSGGSIGQPIGRIEYYTEVGQRLKLICSADMILQSVGGGRVEFDERLREAVPNPRCGTGDRIFLQNKDGQLYVEWRALGGAKPKRSAIGQRHTG